MGTLTQLNAFAAQGLPFTDYRSPTVTFDFNPPVSQTISSLTGTAITQQLTPGTNIIDIRNIPYDIKYSIDMSNTQSGIVMWPSTLQGNLVASTTGNVYSMSGIETLSDWNLVKSPYIYISNPTQNQVIISTINYSTSSNASVSWGTAIVAITPTELTSEMFDNTYISGNATVITGNPTLTSIGVLP